MGAPCQSGIGDNMIYKPNSGQIKDGCMIYEKGVFYLFSMYHKENSDKFNNIWLATSEDGVHFKDYGCVVEDFPDFIWAMKVYRGEDAFYMNSGSFAANGKQAVLKFWKSADLLNWEYMPELDIVAPNCEDSNARLDCMNVVKYNNRYYGYATGQYSFLTSENGENWKPSKLNIKYNPFPEYNSALGGFEVADCIELEDKFYMFCGGFGHLGVAGYGVYIYEADNPEGPFRPCLPFYRINGTSKRWVNMWERFFEKDGEYLAHNYMYDGYSYEKGNVFLPPVKKLKKSDEKLCLEWWNGNNILYGDFLAGYDKLSAVSPAKSVFAEESDECSFSELVTLPDSVIMEFQFTMADNTFTKYSKGGIFLGESKNSGSGILFDTYGKCEIVHIENGKIHTVEDVIGFGSASLYYLESGKTYSIRILSVGGMFEIYVNDIYLQTYNNAHRPEDTSTGFKHFGVIACRNNTNLSDIKIYNMQICED